MIRLYSLLLITSVFVITNAEKVRFDNFTLYKVYHDNDNQVKLLRNLQTSDMRFDFWTEPMPAIEYVNVMSAPEDKDEFETFLSDDNMRFEVKMANVQEYIDKQTVTRYTRSDIRSMGWNSYYTLNDIYTWLDDLVMTYPTIVTEIIGGISYEGTEIKGIKISHGSGKRAIFLEGGIHSREWISPSAVNYITSQLLTSDDEEISRAAQEFDWYIFPVTNPDGYVWSHENNRMWRKNRRPIGTSFGVDLNRNWNSNWLVAGSSVNPATDNYAGPGPFSEPETRSLSAFIRSVGDQLDLYLSFHSYSQLLLLPYGNSTQPYGNYYDALNVGRRAMGALSVRYGTQYVTGNIAEAIYEATGGSVDWVKDQLNVPLAYCYELRDRGEYGFLLPTEQILPNNEETLDSVLEIVHQAKRYGLMNGANVLQGAVILVVAILFGLM